MGTSYPPLGCWFPLVEASYDSQPGSFPTTTDYFRRACARYVASRHSQRPSGPVHPPRQQSMSTPQDDQGHADAHSVSSDGTCSFRAIIVGGGPVGLLMAHALNHAGIDWTLLEREPHIPSPSGASVCLWPHSLRLLDQLGLLAEAKKCGMTMSTKHNHRPDGSEFAVSPMFEQIESNHGHQWLLFHRATLIEMLYTTLQDKEGRVHVGKKMADMETHETGVRVRCVDGTVVDGSIVIGCDGVHSAVRQNMHEMRMQQDAAKATCWRTLGLFGSRNKVDLHPMKTSYNGIIGYAPLPQGFKPGVAYETRSNTRQSFQVLTGPDAAYFLVYKQLDRPRTERVRYTDEDMEALAKSVADHPLNEHVTFGDLWNTRRWALMTDYQEGFVDKWHHGGRVVILGDAAHKVTPNAAFGLNMGWQDVASLTNLLRKQLRASAAAAAASSSASSLKHQPDSAALEALFKAHQQCIETVSLNTSRFSALYTRAIARANPVYYVLEKLSPLIGGDTAMINLLTVPIVKRAVVFDFLPEKEFVEGTYKYTMGPVDGDAEKA